MSCLTNARHKKPGVKLQNVTKCTHLSDIDLLNFFSRRILRSSITATIAIRHTADRGGVQRGERARPAGQTKTCRRNHAQTQLGKAIADKISEGALDTVRSADGFFGTKPTAATPINSCGPNTRKPSANSEAR